jgi:hypothetical protein
MITPAFVKLLGAIGGFCFAYCGVPLAYATLRARKSLSAAPIATAWGIVIGAVCMYAYLFLTYGFDLLLTINYTVEILSWAIVVFYHYKKV